MVSVLSKEVFGIPVAVELATVTGVPTVPVFPEISKVTAKTCKFGFADPLSVQMVVAFVPSLASTSFG